MKKENKILLTGLIAVVLIDTIGSITSRELNFDYSLLSFVSFIIYGTACFFATRAKNLKTGIIYGMILGFFDSTVGLKISILLQANTPDYNYEITLALWIFIVIYMVGFGALTGLIGGGIAWILKRGRTNAQQNV